MLYVAALCSIIFFSGGSSPGDKSVEVSGFVWDAQSGQGVEGTAVFIPGANKGVTVNEYGYFSLQVPIDSAVTLRISRLGYAPETVQITAHADTTLYLHLRETDRQLNEVVVVAAATPQQAPPSANVETIDMKQAASIPTLSGELDVLKVLQLKPGIQSGAEGSSQIFVRGGAPGQNKFLLDGAEVYNPSHMFGYFSVFNPDALEKVQLYKGDFPARYGGKISSVVSLQSKRIFDEFSGSGGLGVISSRITLSSPVVKNQSGLMFGARRTYLDLLTQRINESMAGDEAFQEIPKYRFYDANAVYHHRIGDHHTVWFSGYTGRDRMDHFDQAGMNLIMNWGNTAASVNSEHRLSEKISLRNAAVLSRYDYAVKNVMGGVSVDLRSKISDYTVRSEVAFRPRPGYTLEAGGGATYHNVKLNELNSEAPDVDSGEPVSSSAKEVFHTYETFAYTDHRLAIGRVVESRMGLRFSAFSNKKTYYGLAPRLSLIFFPFSDFNLHLSYGKSFQYLHLLSNSGASLPTDLWYPSSATVKPQSARQASGGVSWSSGKVFIKNEVYYKEMERLPDFRDGGQVYVGDSLEQELVYGEGWAYGNEFSVELTNSRLSGWVGYTLSWSLRQYDEINDGEIFFDSNDSRHNLTLVGNYKLSDRLTVSANWIYKSGRAATLPVGRFVLDGLPRQNLNMVPVYKKRNTYRLDDYHRLDFGICYRFLPRWGDADLALGVYNLYNRRNPQYVYFIEDKNHDKQKTKTAKFIAREVSMFPLIPTVSFNFKF